MSNVDRFRLKVVVLLVLAAIMLVVPAGAPAQVSVGVSVTIGPPPLPLYVQPLNPAPGYIWLPGFWAWDPAFGYYWVPGMWSPAPFIGAFWTPGYWGWNSGVFIWYDGYWGPAVGYYGGHWRGSAFYYNRTVNNINVTNVTTHYSTAVRTVRPAGASFNGPGGATVRPTPEQQAAARERRVSLTGEQEHHMRVAREDPKQRATVNKGRPAIAATVKPGEFTGRGVTGASRAGAGSREPAGRKAAPRERVGTPKPGQEMHPGAVPGRGAPGTQRMERERQPRPEQQQRQKKPQKPQQPKEPKDEEGRGERGRRE